VQNYERIWKKVELCVGLFFVTFLFCAGGLWLRDNRQWLTHVFDSKPESSRAPSYALPNIQGTYTNFTQDWSKFSPAVNFTTPKINIPPPQIPQVRMPYIPPPPALRGFHR